jgi:hypothetical protein
MMGRAAAALLVAGCAIANRAPARPFAVPPEGAAQRMMQSRRYETRDESRILRAAGALLLDLGFTLDKSDESLGVLVASKERTAVETGQVVLALLLSALTRGGDIPYEERQKLRASVVTHPAGERSLALRVTFQRIVWDTHGTITRREQLNRPEQYAEFFDKLSNSLLLEAHDS